ncbi:ferric reductase-like transmembrane domain-containing protein [Sandaracinus amylolyticus]|uniref:Ferric oxidoreductase domain-containing protein n=1 Tax=Sandaracinus amylolyticus TaxID=927083 RepID=A0A0F6YFC4_9BACT|nr:ferric reductase-like transmembrane domain-containing protein [Sandaracinus amylolyticus]AKF03491.1 Hypothetical protein DB32_000640 [Sandaracinus amylolyticus]
MSELDVLRTSGWAAALLLVATLAMTPLSRVLPRARSARRALGIASAIGACAHATIATRTYLDWRGLPSAIAGVAWLRSGALALALLLPLLITSFPIATRALRIRAWKPLHRLVYAVAALVLHHVLLAPFAPRAWGIALGAAFAGLAILRVTPHRRSSEVPVADAGRSVEP